MRCVNEPMKITYLGASAPTLPWVVQRRQFERFVKPAGWSKKKENCILAFKTGDTHP
jgi:hypothetical protein